MKHIKNINYRKIPISNTLEKAAIIYEEICEIFTFCDIQPRIILEEGYDGITEILIDGNKDDESLDIIINLPQLIKEKQVNLLIKEIIRLSIKQPIIFSKIIKTPGKNSPFYIGERVTAKTEMTIGNITFYYTYSEKSPSIESTTKLKINIYWV